MLVSYLLGLAACRYCRLWLPGASSFCPLAATIEVREVLHSPGPALPHGLDPENPSKQTGHLQAGVALRSAPSMVWRATLPFARLLWFPNLGHGEMNFGPVGCAGVGQPSQLEFSVP